MKYLVIIFSLYMTMLTLLPCQDSEDLGKSSIEVLSLKKSLKGISHLNQENCPPFCTCACCSVSRHFLSVKNQGSIFSFNRKSYTSYRIPAIIDQPIVIYQPPKLA